ncbi:MAG: enoyl-CoA hydratase/isomerase family protein [Pyrinomonadaceae bacterium]
MRYGDALVIKFIRPKARNPFSIETLKLLHLTLDSINSDGEFKKVIFTGADDVFASGADLREIAKLSTETAREYAMRGQSLMNKIADSAKLIIAAVNGFCFGGALDLALACDKRIASPNAIFCHPGVSLGIITGWGGTQRLPRLVGEAAALEMFLTAKKVDAKEALRIGLIDEMVKKSA